MRNFGAFFETMTQLRGTRHRIVICSETQLSKIFQNSKSTRHWECSAFDAWNSTLLVITCHNEDESFQRNCCLSSACQWIQIQRNDKCPLQVECGKIHQFSNINCMSLYKVHRVFISILLFRLVYLLPVTIQAPLPGKSYLWNVSDSNLTCFRLRVLLHLTLCSSLNFQHEGAPEKPS